MFEKPDITVLGVGNLLLSDEGFGCHIIEDLAKEYKFSDNVQLLDGGTMGMELLHYIGDAHYILLVDAIDGGKEPGTVYHFVHDTVKDYFTDHVSIHEVGMQDILQIRQMQENPFKEAVVIGVEPKSLEIGMDLSPEVQEQVPRVKELIIDQLKQWSVEVTKL